jgi:hypothetical protein
MMEKQGGESRTATEDHVQESILSPCGAWTSVSDGDEQWSVPWAREASPLSSEPVRRFE